MPRACSGVVTCVPSTARVSSAPSPPAIPAQHWVDAGGVWGVVCSRGARCAQLSLASTAHFEWTEMICVMVCETKGEIQS